MSTAFILRRQDRNVAESVLSRVRFKVTEFVLYKIFSAVDKRLEKPIWSSVDELTHADEINFLRIRDAVEKITMEELTLCETSK